MDFREVPSARSDSGRSRLTCTDVAGRPHPGRRDETIRHDSRDSGSRRLRDADSGRSRQPWHGSFWSGCDGDDGKTTASIRHLHRIWTGLPSVCDIYHWLALTWLNPAIANACPRRLAHALPQSNAVTICKTIQANDLASLEEADAYGSGFLARGK